MIQCVNECFGINEQILHDKFREDENYRILSRFLDGTGPPKVLFYMQRPDMRGTYDELIDSHEDPRLLITFGDTERIKSKAAFFYRTSPDGRGVNVQNASDNEVIYGEIGAQPIMSLENVITSAYVPMVNSIDEGEWGECEPEQRQEFVGVVNKFAAELTEAMMSLTGGVELRKPDPDIVGDMNAQYSNDERRLTHCENIAEDWINVIERIIDAAPDARWERNESGPHTELEYWRSRNQKLTSISEQMRSKDIKGVINILNTAQKLHSDVKPRSLEKISLILNRFKTMDIKITEALNEAKDNVKYLTTLEKFIEPLYTGTPQTIIDSLPALMNSVKMIHTIARYYNTTEKMTQLFMKITSQMITNCKKTILQGKSVDKLWLRDPDELITTIQTCIQLNAAYQRQYEMTREKLLLVPKGKQFDFSKNQIFGKFDLFVRRLNKLIDLFSTLRQFVSLTSHKLEDMDELLKEFKGFIKEFENQRHDLLDFSNGGFDRVFVQFNVNISSVEQKLQSFIEKSFDKSNLNIEQALNLLKKFQTILKRGSLRNQLQSKYNKIFSKFATEMEEIRNQYTQHCGSPPLVRNMPTVAGNIMWANHLLHRIYDPMHNFPENFTTDNPGCKTSVQLYNRICETLEAFKLVYLHAWCNEIEKAKASLQCTLIYKHLGTHKLYVNFDMEITQLIREAKCLDRMNMPIPESARIVLLQEEKFKMYHNELHYVLTEHERVSNKILPITGNLLKPHVDDLNYKLRPGMVTLTWTSMNIDGYLHHVHSGLQQLEQLVIGINDIIENRIENNLKLISKVLLVEMPEEHRTYSQDEFVELQQNASKQQTALLVSKNIEVERAVDDLLTTICAYPLDSHVAAVNTEEVTKLKKYYNWTMYQALLHCTKNSLNAMKDRVCGKRVKGMPMSSHMSPFFEVLVQLEENDGVKVSISPNLDDVQDHINRAAIAVLKCSKSVVNWFQQDKGDDEEKESFYDMIAQDKEIVKVILLLTGSIHGTKNVVKEYLDTFGKYAWLWTDNLDKTVIAFSKKEPGIEEYEEKLKFYTTVEAEIEQILSTFQIGSMALRTDTIKANLIDFVGKWKTGFAKDLHKRARTKLDNIFEYISQTTNKLGKEVTGIDTLRYIMTTLKEVRQKEGEIELELKPLLEMYDILDFYLPNGMEKDEQDHRHILRSKWKSLVQLSEQRQNELLTTQNQYKLDLIKGVKALIKDVKEFRKDYDANGPMVTGIDPREAVERLRRFQEEFSVRKRNFEINFAGEELFNLPHQPYPDLEQTSKELDLLAQLYDLYTQVIETVNSWKEMTWSETKEKIDEMKDNVESFSAMCRKLPRQLKEWPAYKELRQEIDDFSEILPLMKELAKPSIRDRHWQELIKVTNAELKVDNEDMFYLSQLLAANLLDHKEDIEEITESADKQLRIQSNLDEIKVRWEVEAFEFEPFRNREYPIRLVGSKVQEIQEALEEAQAALTTMNAMKHVTPFKAEVMNYLITFSDVTEAIDRWVKVQMLWSSLEPVFTGGDIAKAMPTEARRFQNIDKTWIKIMESSVERGRVIPCCQNEMLKNLLPSLQDGLESCQKSLENYLETKRGKFARFYFVSNPVLLTILSQGSEPTSIQPFLENLFDAINKVQFDKVDRKMITHMISNVASDEEVIQLSEPVKAEGNIEDWLKKIEEEMQRTIRDVIRNASRDCMQMGFADFVERYCSQAGLAGLQMLWTFHVNEGLEKLSREKNIMTLKKNKVTEIMDILLKLCLSDLPSALRRMCVETLVTIHVNQRDVLNRLTTVVSKDPSNKGSYQNHFEWQKQTRIAWRNDTDHCVISVTDQDFNYSYEYLGTKDRLCITPLTDRCYITMAQALGMYYGGAPAGPAGTGKTETVKDLGRTLGVFVVVTNCSDQHRYKDMAKIFKGLCMSGLWGCFDEFNRIELEVLSVVAMQVGSITNAKKNGDKFFNFPGEPQPINLVPTTAYFITMNPGYAGRQELPENLKVLFRGVAMMVPDRFIIIKVKLASYGYTEYEALALKFKVLYGLCEEQLSKQRHYDFGLRNILSVLRTAGGTKREFQDSPEDMLLMRSLRDMNLSKLVFDDVPLFLQLLRDIFPTVKDPPKTSHGAVEKAIHSNIEGLELIDHPSWALKIIQLYETNLVRHGFMLVGPTGVGKTEIETVLTKAMGDVKVPYKLQRMNPKAITPQEMYGVKIEISDEWIEGVFSNLWKRSNNRNLKYNTWIICDGPVDAIWIENLNTVLDDNKILTLANNDRIPMTENVKLVFEVENLNSASPATVSRCGIVFVSEDDLGWEPLVIAWKNRGYKTEKPTPLKPEQVEMVKDALFKYLKDNDLMIRLYKSGIKFSPVMRLNQAVLVSGMLTLITGLVRSYGDCSDLTAVHLEKIVIYAITWIVGGMFEPEDRAKFHEYLSRLSAPMPSVDAGETIFEYWFNPATKNWARWTADEWKKAPGKMTFASLLIPTMDSTRAEYIISTVQRLPMDSSFKYRKQVLLVGGSGTAKTSTALMYCSKLPLNMVLKKINFSSATQPKMFQDSIEADLDKTPGKSFMPANNKTMVVFLDDLSMPFVNDWGDQVTLEIVRQLIDQGGFYFLDKDRRGDFKRVENLTYIAAMNHPGGGRNSIPMRLTRQFVSFNMVLPSIASVDNIYGEIIRTFFTSKRFPQADLVSTANELTRATIMVWERVKKRFLPTPSQFHYMFNMRELSRVFQGVFEVLKTNEGADQMKKPLDFIGKPEYYLIGLWKHECERVFEDKLTTLENKQEFANMLKAATIELFGQEAEDKLSVGLMFCDFQRDDVMNEDGELEQEAPKVYEVVPSAVKLRKRLMQKMEEYSSQGGGRSMKLVLFDDALKHLLRISRIIQLERGNAMLVGVGGSGKQSLTRLAAFIGRHICFQIQLTKTYNQNALFDDLKQLYKWSGHEGKKTTFLLTDSEIKEEFFLEFINSILSTGEVAGLLPKEDKDIIIADMRQLYQKERPSATEPTNLELYNYFIDRVRDNLHIVLCFSPVGNKFRERFRKFPALFNQATIDWFLPWPEDALVSVSKSFIQEFKIDTPQETKDKLCEHMGTVHKMVTEVCGLYFNKMRRQVFVTPKSYLSFIEMYKSVYAEKLADVEDQEYRVNLGLKKLKGASEGVKQMQGQLDKEQEKLKEADRIVEELLKKLEVERADASRQAADVKLIKDGCEAQAAEIRVKQEEADRDLKEAEPFLIAAMKAVESIKPSDIQLIKVNRNPVDIIRLVLDGALILQHLPVIPMKEQGMKFGKLAVNFIKDSYEESGKGMVINNDFLKNLLEFSANERDNINEETCELLEPYLTLEGYNPATAKNASEAAEGLCGWVGAMVSYIRIAKIVKPKKDYLAKQTDLMNEAMEKLRKVENQLAKVEAKKAGLEADAKEKEDKKRELQENLNKLKMKMTEANNLINGLSGENARWTEDSHNFADMKRRLVGDVAIATAFISYCGPFNSEFRSMLMKDYYMADLRRNDIPYTTQLELTKFLVDKTVVQEWNLKGLPKDDLSTQNGIMVTTASRYPLMIDPQGQALKWIKNKEVENLIVTNQKARDFKDVLRFAIQEGKSLLIENIENEVDPGMDPVLEKQIIRKGRSAKIKLGDDAIDFSDAFKLFMTSRLSNPLFSPELAAKTTIIDFTVTLTGLEQQLLSRVLSKEQRSLEETLQQLNEEITLNTKISVQYDKALLERLTNSEGDLIEDKGLIEALNNTKAKAREVEAKLAEADEKTRDINEKRELYRPVATRGSLLYFCIVDMSMVNWMYNTSLNQFLAQFDLSIETAEKNPPSERINNIITTLTYTVYRYINRGLFEKDKMTFILMICLKIMIVAGKLTPGDIGIYLRSGAALDIKTERANTYKDFISDTVWLNILALSRHYYGRESLCFFKELPENIGKNLDQWKRWITSNDPENERIPDFEERIVAEREIGTFIKLTLVRGLREDRTVIYGFKFIESILRDEFTKPVNDSIERILETGISRIPILFLLSAGADPTSSLEDLAKRKRKYPIEIVSMGEGQDEIAREAIKSCFLSGRWVLLNNCHLGLKFMEEIETLLGPSNEIEDDFRLWLTCEPRDKFPIGLLQMATKMTLEPPKGVKAGLLRTFSTVVDNDWLEKHDGDKWRKITYSICFLHSIVQERRKFGPLGWCIPYEFNSSDLIASLTFLDRHISQAETSNTQPNWDIIRFMVCEIQYGGRITDSIDLKLFFSFGNEWIDEKIMRSDFCFNGMRDYIIPDFMETSRYQEYISAKLAAIDSPTIFFLNNNADLTFRKRESNEMLNTISMTQPKEGGAGAGKSRDDVIIEKVHELLGKMPADYAEADFRDRIKNMKAKNLPDKGFNIPLNVFLFQELQRLQFVITKVRTTLISLIEVRAGNIILTPELQAAGDFIFEARVPVSWFKLPGASDEFAWISPTLGLWFTGLLERNIQLGNWLSEGRPKTYWLTGFFNPQGFLTAVKQEVTRFHKNDNWALDSVSDFTDIIKKDIENIKEAPTEGCYIRGLFLEGARWSMEENRLDELQNKDTNVPMPVIHFSAKVQNQFTKGSGKDQSSLNSFDCPCYKYPTRTDKYYIFTVALKHEGSHLNEQTCRLRGIALLCSIDQ
jgi:dynein heavy chain